MMILKEDWISAVCIKPDRYGCTGKTRQIMGFENAWVFIFDGDPDQSEHMLHESDIYFRHNPLGMKPFKKKSKRK